MDLPALTRRAADEARLKRLATQADSPTAYHPGDLWQGDLLAFARRLAELLARREE